MRAAAAVVLVALCVPLAAGCTDGDAEEAEAVAVYLVRDGKVAPVRRVVDTSEGGQVAGAVEALSGGPTAEERSAGYTTSFPRELPLVLSGGTAEVERDVSGLAAAQLVHTLTQFPEVERVVIGGKELTRKAFEDESPQILVESPLPGDTVSSPIRLAGTANVFEATVSIEVRDAEGNVILETFTTATSGTGTRGTFATELDLGETTGEVTIVAFESSAKDGTPLHVAEVPVSVER